MIIHNIQILRGFAAIFVVLYHSIELSVDNNLSLNFFLLFEGIGAFGVDLFFVISGFIMMFIHLNRPQTIKSFVIARVIRIVPLYWLLTMFFFIVMIFRNEHDYVHLTSSMFFMSHILSFEEPVLYLGWTLEYEVIFYVIFALSLIFTNEKIRLYVVCCMLYVASFVLSLTMLEFFLGMIAAYIYKYYQFKSKVFLLFLLTTGLVLMYFSHFIQLIDQLPRFIKWGIPSFLIVVSLLYLYQIKGFFLNLLGDASYSIYLIQVFSLPLIFKFSFIFNNSDLFVFFSVFFTILTGIGLYYFAERPMTLYLKQYKKGRFS